MKVLAQFSIGTLVEAVIALALLLTAYMVDKYRWARWVFGIPIAVGLLVVAYLIGTAIIGE